MTQNLEKAIKNKKNKLINECKTKGIYENFGQKEVRELREKFLDVLPYSQEKLARNLILAFDNWCMSYNGEKK